MFKFDSEYEQIETQKRKLPRIRDDMDNLTKDVITAERKGIKYHELITKRYAKKGIMSLQEEREKKRETERLIRGNCKKCGAHIVKDERQGGIQFCSLACMQAYKAEQRKREIQVDYEVPKQCRECGREIDGKRRWCEECAKKRKKEQERAAYEARKAENGPRHCPICGKITEIDNRGNYKRFCGQECLRVGMSIQNRKKGNDEQ